MSIQLIINADDLGLTPGVNRAIFELHDAGALSSATLMSNGPALDHAVTGLRSRPALGVGCHVVLADGLPVSSPSTIPSLIDPQSGSRPRLRSSLAAFARAALSGQLHEREIEQEAEAQITRLLHAGIRPTHLDTHKHTHLFPVVLRPLLRVAERLGIPAIRNPFEPNWTLGLGAGSPVRRLQIRVLTRFHTAFTRALAEHDGRIQSTDGALGVSATGTLDHASLAALLAALPAGTWELVCHPGYNDPDLATVTTRLRAERETERSALLALLPPTLAREPQLHLVSFAALTSRTSIGHP